MEALCGEMCAEEAVSEIPEGDTSAGQYQQPQHQPSKAANVNSSLAAIQVPSASSAAQHFRTQVDSSTPPVQAVAAPPRPSVNTLPSDKRFDGMTQVAPQPTTQESRYFKVPDAPRPDEARVPNPNKVDPLKDDVADPVVNSPSARGSAQGNLPKKQETRKEATPQRALKYPLPVSAVQKHLPWLHADEVLDDLIVDWVCM
jgi:hypothetical protein